LEDGDAGKRGGQEVKVKVKLLGVVKGVGYLKVKKRSL